MGEAGICNMVKRGDGREVERLGVVEGLSMV